MNVSAGGRVFTVELSEREAYLLLLIMGRNIIVPNSVAEELRAEVKSFMTDSHRMLSKFDPVINR